jgi:hypothetical protein
MKTKTCTKCKKEKDIDSFYNYKDVVDYYCKYCRGAANIKSQHKQKSNRSCKYDGCPNPHYAKDLCRNHYTRLNRYGSLDLIKKRDKEWYNKYLSYTTSKKNHLKHYYKLTVEQYDAMAKDGCHICGKEALEYKRLHVDHDHKCCGPNQASCGACVRGILCDSCNMAVGKYENGKLRDDFKHRDKIIYYVTKYNFIIRDRKANENTKTFV